MIIQSLSRLCLMYNAQRPKCLTLDNNWTWTDSSVQSLSKVQTVAMVRQWECKKVVFVSMSIVCLMFVHAAGGCWGMGDRQAKSPNNV